VCAVALVVALFKLVPLALAEALGLTGFAFLLAEGALRVGVFVAYLAVLSCLPHLQRLYAYHAAEHQAVHCYEQGLPLTVANVMRQSRIHPRCGTAFLLWVMVVAVGAYALVGHPSLALLVASRVALLPLIAGATFELIKLSARTDSALVRALTAPGRALQYLTTRPCDERQAEVAIAALEAALAAAQRGEYVTAPKLAA
jgi:uncharacterized protein YqhQ